MKDSIENFVAYQKECDANFRAIKRAIYNATTANEFNQINSLLYYSKLMPEQRKELNALHLAKDTTKKPSFLMRFTKKLFAPWSLLLIGVFLLAAYLTWLFFHIN